jgi:hypothetical protein
VRKALVGLLLLPLTIGACGTAPGEQSLAILNRTAAHVNVEFLDGRQASVDPCSAYMWTGPEDAVWTLRYRDHVVTSGELAGQGQRRAVAITVMPDGSSDVDVSLDGIVTDPPDPHPCEGEVAAPTAPAPASSASATSPVPASAEPSAT